MRAFVVVLSLGLAACGDCNKTDTTTPASDATAPDASTARALPSGPVNATPVPTASVTKLVNPDNLPVYQRETGSVEGTVTVTGEPPLATIYDFSKCPDAEKMYGVSFRKGDHDALADAIVVATGYKGFVPEKDEAKQLVIKDCAFDRRTVTLTFGQRLEIKNETKDYWSPQLEPNMSPVLMIAVPNGDAVKIYPKKPGRYLLVDHDRKYVVADLYAFLHPLHASTDITGHYRIDAIPVGKVQIGVTHPRFDATKTIDVDVKPNVVQKVDVTLEHKRNDAGSGAPPSASPTVH